MKVSMILGSVSLLSLSSAALLPRVAQAGAAAIAKRAPIDSAYDIASALYTEIQTYTGSINSTAAATDPSADQATKDAATASVGEQLNSITAAVNAAKAEVDALPQASDEESTKLMVRQTTVTPDTLALLLEQILLEVSGALNNIIATLGLDPLLAFLNPLVASLSGLLLSLNGVVQNILILVQELVAGLLIGLSIGLAGIVL